MATRRQPARRARKSRLESGGQTKKPKKCKIHSELRPILSGSASSSTVACSSGLSMGNRHQWSEEEELAVFAEAETLLNTQKFCTKSMLNAALAERLNALFPEVAVKFTDKTVKNKLELFKERWSAGRQLIACRRAPITCSETVLNILFSETASASETTNSGAADAGSSKSKAIHRWKPDEGRVLVETINELSPRFPEMSSEFRDAGAGAMNQKHAHDINFASLDGDKVKYKLKELKKDYNKALANGVGENHVWTLLAPRFSRPVSSQRAQSTSSYSVGANEGPYSKLAALTSLSASGCPYNDLYHKYTYVLDIPRALELFWANETYEQKLGFLEFVYQDEFASKGLAAQEEAGGSTTPTSS